MENKQLSEIFKAEYSNLVAVLCHYYGTDMQSAEDIVSETFINAMKAWSLKGLPDSPKAWLRKVAQNKYKDQYRRSKTFEQKIVPEFKSKDAFTDESLITEEIIEDSQLKMLFVVCDPDLGNDSQICLALRILCGFNIEEITKALLSNKEAINKKLYRAKQVIKQKDEFMTSLAEGDYINRLDPVLRVIYLLFNEGYYSSVNESNIRHEICWEAIRLCRFLEEQSFLDLSKIRALIALMCFHASRLDARLSDEQDYLLYDEQDKTKWNTPLIEKGKSYLHQSSNGDTITKYHLEAAIAYWHTVESEEKWSQILQLYNRLLMIEYSPVIAMNRTYALAKANSVDEAIVQAEKLKLSGSHLYYCLLAELHRMKEGNSKKEVKYLEIALKLALKKNERKLIKRKIEEAMA